MLKPTRIHLLAEGLAVMRRSGRWKEFQQCFVSLGEIRDRELYRIEYPGFESFVTNEMPGAAEFVSCTGFSVDDFIDMARQMEKEDN